MIDKPKADGLIVTSRDIPAGSTIIFDQRQNMLVVEKDGRVYVACMPFVVGRENLKETAS